MTKQQRDNLSSENYLDLKVKQAVYEKKLNDAWAKYTLEPDWEKACKIQKRIDVLKKDCKAIDHAIATRLNAVNA